MSDRPLVIYHAGCWDGFCAAWVARAALGHIEAFPAQYGMSAPLVKGRSVYILDFSYKREALIKMKMEADFLLVLDHHKSAEQDLAGLDFCRFDMKKSGGRLTWEFFFGTREAPWLVDYTEDRDLWLHRLPASNELNAALRSYPLDFDVWDGLLKEGPSSGLALQGVAIRRAERQMVELHVRNAAPRLVAGQEVLTVNATVLQSEIAGELAKGRPFGACYFDRSDGKRVWSLRSDENGVDVSEVAKKFGGGGHFHAAGFEG
jgi:hypothetical protein